MLLTMSSLSRCSSSSFTAQSVLAFNWQSQINHQAMVLLTGATLEGKTLPRSSHHSLLLSLHGGPAAGRRSTHTDKLAEEEEATEDIFLFPLNHLKASKAKDLAHAWPRPVLLPSLPMTRTGE